MCSGCSQFCPCRGALSGAVSATRAFTLWSTGAVPVPPPQVAQKGWWLSLRARRALAPHSPLGPAPQMCSCASALGETLQLILQRGERGDHVLSCPSRAAHVPQNTEHTCRFCSYISEFLSEGFSALFSHPPAQGAVTNISS